MRVKLSVRKRLQKEAAEVSASRAKLRMDVCKACPFYTAIGACRKCGCYMPVKTTLPSAKCPLGKW